MTELCCEYLSVRCIWLLCSYHVTYVFQSESTLYSCLNVKELVAWNKRDIWSSSDCKSQMHRTDKYSQYSSIIWLVWLNGWVFIYDLSGCEFKPCWSNLNFRYRAYFEQEVPWHSDNYRFWLLITAT